MFFRCLAIVGLIFSAAPKGLSAQDADQNAGKLYLELNSLQDVEAACRMTFSIQNRTGSSIDKAVFETVFFDTSGKVISLSLFDFRDLPADRVRVRQFDLPNRSCDSVGQALINGANTCVVGNAESAICLDALKVGSRLSVELLG